MAKFRTGLEIEDRLKTILERIGCSITEDPDLDHAWKIDFVITRFPQIPSIFALGIQVTARMDDLAKLEEFLRIHQYNRIAEKVMYLEFDKYADLDKGGGFAAFAAMLDYRLNTYWRTTPIIGIRVNNDLSITTFNLQERIAELRKKLAQPYQQQQAAPASTRQPSGRPNQPRAEQRPESRNDQRRPDASSQAAPSLPSAPEAQLPPPGETILPASNIRGSLRSAVKMIAEPEPANLTPPPQKSVDEVASAPPAEKKPRRRRSRPAKSSGSVK